MLLVQFNKEVVLCIVGVISDICGMIKTSAFGDVATVDGATKHNGGLRFPI